MSREELWRIWEQLNKSRELEISTLWQRSIFLSAFILLQLAGCGIFYKDIVLEVYWQTISIKSCLTGIFLGLILYVSGVLWVGMSKGAKYWFEVYERKIDLIENLLFVPPQMKYLEEKYLNEIPETAIDGKQYIQNKELVSPLGWFGLKAGKVSPSKINIFIGWFIVVIGLLYSGFFQIVYWWRIFDNNTTQIIGNIASFGMLISVIVPFLFCKQLRSSNNK